MASAAAPIRRLVSDALAARIPGALEPRVWTDRERVSTGTEVLDELLSGGLPVGAISELVGPQCSGRTSAALAVVAALTQAGKVCAWVDGADTLDPEAAAGAGVDLARMLWVRCGTAAVPAPRGAVEVRSAVLDGLAETGKPVGPGSCGRGSLHPRNESKGMGQALESLLQQQPRSSMMKPARRGKGVGTPGMANRAVDGVGEQRTSEKLQKGVSARARAALRQEGVLHPAGIVANARGEQIAFDRLPPRRGSNLHLPTHVQQTMHVMGAGSRVEARAPRWSMRDGGALDQALRATDLLLANGGFAALVLDLGSTPRDVAWKIPLSTWFRYRAACDRTRTSLVVLTQHSCAKSSAEAVVRMRGGEFEAQGRVVTAVRFGVELERQRFQRDVPLDVPVEDKVVSIRKPPQRAHASEPTVWRRVMGWVRSAQ